MQAIAASIVIATVNLCTIFVASTLVVNKATIKIIAIISSTEALAMYIIKRIQFLRHFRLRTHHPTHRALSGVPSLTTFRTPFSFLAYFFQHPYRHTRQL